MVYTGHMNCWEYFPNKGEGIKFKKAAAEQQKEKAMNTFKQTLVLAAVGLMASLSLVACGGSGSTNTQTTAPNPGVPTSGVSKGVVESQLLGSITVNGIQFETTGANIKIDDVSGTESALKPGMVVKVKGTFDDRTGTATEIEFEDNVQGPIEGINNTTKTITVLGQTVKVEDNVTRFNDDTMKTFSTATAAGGPLALGNIVEISGFSDDKGGIRATRIEKKDSGEFEVKGFVSGLFNTGFTLRLTPSSTTAFNVTLGNGVSIPAGVANGSFVEVRSAAALAPGANSITASSIQLEDNILGANNEKVEVEGLIISGTDFTNFVVNGQTITASGALFENGTAADFALGTKVEVEGRISGTTLVATKVSFRSNIKIEATVGTVVASSFTLLEKIVNVNEFTDFRNVAGVSGLAAGNRVEIRARLDRDGNLLATRVTLEGPDNNNRAFLQGPVTAKNAAAGTLTILGITVTINTSSELFKDDSSILANKILLADFFGLIVEKRTVVKVRWDDFTSTSVPIKEAEIEGSR